MTKHSMIWEMIHTIFGEMVMYDMLPATKKLFEDQCIIDIQEITSFTEVEIKEVLENAYETGFLEVISEVYSIPTINI